MNIVYISNLSGNKSHGPSFSVPAQVSAQANYDNVFWFNTNNDYLEHWGDTGVFHSLNEYPKCRLADFPIPFNHPDIIIFEGFYFPVHCKMALESRKLGIPYVIVPRGSLTKGAQMVKPLKKFIGNIIMFRRFVRNAASIQYLTEQEYLDSGDKWNNNYFIIPNGIEMKEQTKKWSSKKKLKGIYIGRMHLFHKGIDLLIEACNQVEDKFSVNQCSILLCGPELDGYKMKIEQDIENKKLNHILKVQDGLYGEDKKNALLDADFFIMTSRFEGHPMGLVEALSYGLPCLVTEGTNMAQEIASVDAGWTAENDAESIKKALLQMFSDRMVFSDKGNNALKLSKKYDWVVLARLLHDKYSGLLHE